MTHCSTYSAPSHLQCLPVFSFAPIPSSFSNPKSRESRGEGLPLVKRTAFGTLHQEGLSWSYPFAGHPRQVTLNFLIMTTL